MWTCGELGLAAWSDQGSGWHFNVHGGSDGIGLSVGAAPSSQVVSLQPVDQDRLPVAGEQYVRGSRLQVNYPQGEGSYAIRLAVEPIVSQANLIVLELTVAIQTDLLDTHPKIDVDSLCDDIDSLVPSDESGDHHVAQTGSAPISIAKSGDHFVAVLLGPHDSPFTTNHSTDSLLRLRLFGDFLEKGVIRKARPWIVVDRSGNPPDHSQLTEWWKQLCGSPLPLTP